MPPIVSLSSLGEIYGAWVMWNDLPMPRMAGSLKIWPVHSRPEYRFFIAYEGKPYYFRTYNEALLFARDKQAIDDPELLCD
jgi:hypothetical protein